MRNTRDHPPDCGCAECILGENDIIVDLANSINLDQVFAFNEKTQGNCKKIFKPKDLKLDKTDFTESNDGDPDLLIYIPFSCQCKIKSMTLIGGEEGTSPSCVKLYVNKENPDFDLVESKATQEIDCVEDFLGENPYNLSPSKFGDVWSITLIVTGNYSGDNSKIYYIGFEGIASKKKQRVLVGTYELNPLPNTIQHKGEKDPKSGSIFG